MKRSVLLPLLLLAAILLFSLWVGAVVGTDTETWREQLRQAAQMAQAENWPDAKEALSASYAAWSDRQTFLHITARHDAVDDAEAMYRRAMAFAEAEEPSEFLAEINDLQDQLRLLAETEQLRLGNVL